MSDTEKTPTRRSTMTNLTTIPKRILAMIARRNGDGRDTAYGRFESTTVDEFIDKGLLAVDSEYQLIATGDGREVLAD
jgi:hypothetical protein